jgi:hypothetical protein
MKWYSTILILMCLLCSGLSIGQKTLYQDVFYGGVTGAGYNPTWTSNSPGVIRINIESGSTIRKALLLVGVYGYPNEHSIQLNDINIIMDSTISVSDKFVQPTQTNLLYLSTGVVDITNSLTPSDTIINIIPPVSQPSISTGNRFVEYYVFVSRPKHTHPSTNLKCHSYAVGKNPQV